MIADAGADRPPVVLLCGGLGLRQRADGDDMPKPLRPLPDGRALLLHVLDYYRRFDLHEFVLCVGYGADRIRALLAAYFSTPEGDLVTGPGWQRFTADGLQVTLVDGGPYAEKSDRLLASLPHIGPRPFLLGYGDVLSDLDLDLLLRTPRRGRRPDVGRDTGAVAIRRAAHRRRHCRHLVRREADAVVADLRRLLHV